MALTLGTMKARIADEIARPDLSSQIANAINDAISAYQNERFFFNETRAVTWNSVAGQEFYDGADSANIPLIQKIDYVYFYINNFPYRLDPELPGIMEGLSISAQNVGQPAVYSFYNLQFRFYPVPSASGWLFRVGCTLQKAAPADDNEANNVWMTYAERLIRSRAKFELAVHVLFDQEMAAMMNGNIAEAYTQLKEQTTNITKLEGNSIVAMDF